MSYNGSGTFNINTAGQPVVTGTVISSTAFNALTADLGTGLSTAITKDGQTVATARIPFAAGINSSLVTDATSTTTGSIITAGGVGIAKALFVGTTANIAGTTTLAGVTATSITDSGLTSGRVTYAGTAGLLQDSANLTFNGTTLTANTIGAFTLAGTVAGGGNQLNNVIIGTTTPLAGAFTTLSATGGAASIPFTASSTAADAYFGFRNLGTGGVYWTLISTNNSSGAGGGTLRVWDNTNNKDCLSIKADNSVALQGATVKTGTGITFPATQSASTDANTLDDYEEGTWTPNQGSGLTVVGAFSSVGRYTKIGNMVTVWGQVTGSTSVSVSSTGNICTNLPFALEGSVGINGIATGYFTANNAAAHISIGATTTVTACQALAAAGSIGFTITYRF